MDLQTLAFDNYQSALINGIKLKALFECLTEEQKVLYYESIKKQTEEFSEKLKGKENTEEVLEVLRSLHNID